MPSLSSLLKRSKSKKNPETRSASRGPDGHGSGIASQGPNDEKLNRRQSRRGDFFRHLMGKPRAEGSQKEAQLAREIPQNHSRTMGHAKSSPASPTADSNKPLPPPPAPGVSEPEPPKEVVQMKRIIEPLKLADIHNIFSGAPQFFVRSEGHHAGPPHPSVAFLWNTELEIRDLSDHGQIENAAWGCVTTTPHIIRAPRLDGHKEEGEDDGAACRLRFVPRCKERPNALSMQGLERGTVGFQAALEIAVADALHEQKPSSVQLARSNFLNDKKHGLRHLDENSVISRLVLIGEAYHEKVPPTTSSLEMYTELFTRVLYPPTRVSDSENPYSLHVQIEALVHVLTAPVIWIDFSNVEWRIRLGQILWGPPFQPGEDDVGSNSDHPSHKPEGRRFWLLLQILLSCELVTRLDAVAENAQRDPSSITDEEIHKFEKNVTRTVKWSLLLARLWLENIRVEHTVPETPLAEKRPSGWLATIKNAVTGEHEVEHHSDIGITEFHSRHQKRQIDGLIHFARKLRWPEADLISEKFANLKPLRAEKGNLSAQGTPGATPTVGTPLSMTTQRSSYFAGVGRPGVRRGLSQNRMENMFHPSGWLSKSYLTGLILPGEGLSHFLMSTLLENDEIAVARLGDDANLYGGFVYSGRSYWSTACIIGRVLAAGKGASECMGWLSSTVVPKGVGEGWVNVEVELEPRSDGEQGPHSARIWKKHIVEQDSHVLGDGDASTVLPQDFTLPPPDVPDPINLEVNLQTLDLFTGVDSVDSTPSQKDTPGTETSVANLPVEIRTYSALMQFGVKKEAEEPIEMGFALSYDVQFVTAHPCVPSKHTRLLEAASNAEKPELQLQDAPGPSGRRPSGPHTLFTGHPLHKSYNFSRHSLSSVVFASPNSPPPLLSLHTDSTEIFVIDCTEPSPPEAGMMEEHPFHNAYVSRKRRFGSDLEMLARAWCAEKGYNALVSRRGRNCIACSIREARALSWKIVLRFG